MSRKRLFCFDEDELTARVSIPKGTLRYIDEWLTMRCAVDMQTWGVFPNAKEIQESFAAFRAMRYRVLRGWKRGQAALGDRNIGVICIGDGSTPRTGVTFALRSRWPVVSIDPVLRVTETWEARVNNLRCFKVYDYDLSREDFDLITRHFTGVESVVLVFTHSHAELGRSVEDIFSPRFPVRAIISNPCCVPHKLKELAEDFTSRGFPWGYEEYEDWGMWSPQRTVKVAWMKK